ncbi:unnamed protein product [Cuscuta europaea]|uniref:Uncharacterized protein n=1 Tax=Cuscuta europaea TaxID=41803 RepID=A0A9P0Z5D9_CUSEU|nr:unnamed protein product [Cuscuta europaea]
MKTKTNLSTKKIIIVILLLITLIADVCADPVSAVSASHGGGGGGHSGGSGAHGSGVGENGGARVVPAVHGNNNNNQHRKGNRAQLMKPPVILPGRHGFAWDTITSMFGLHLDAVIIINLLVFFLI